MKFKTNPFLFMMLGAMTFSCWGTYYNTIEVDGISINLDKNKSGTIIVHDQKSNENYSCKLGNWDDSLLSGAGNISLNSDHVGVLIAPNNKYLVVDDIINCKEKSIRIHYIPYFDGDISSIIDVNFEKS